jgi:hypothetical protein
LPAARKENTAKQLFPVCLKRASFQTSGDKIKAVVSEDETWQFYPVLQAQLRGLAIPVTVTSSVVNTNGVFQITLPASVPRHLIA